MPPNSQNPLLQKLYKAHLEYEVFYFTGPNFKKQFVQEFAPLEKWLQDQPLQNLLSEEDAQEIALDLWKSPEWVESLHHILATLLSEEGPQNKIKNLALEELIPSQVFEKIKDFSLDNAELRQQFLRLLVGQEVYARLIYDLLFHGIRDFVVEENPLTKNIPAAGKIFKFGREMVEKRLPKVSEEAEKKIKSFIKPYLHRPIKHTKEFLEDPKNQKLFDDLQSELINWVKTQKIGTAQLRTKQKETVLQITEDVLIHWQKHPLAQEILKLTVSRFYEKHGHMTLPEIMKAYQIPQKDILKKLADLTHGMFKRAQKEGQLEAALAQHLKGFYESEIAQKLMRSKDE